MGYQVEFRPYHRQFRSALITSHGRWEVREGVLLRLMNQMGHIGWGEIAPIAWFGSESIEHALEFCRQLPSEIFEPDIFSIPDALPACQFGFESAWQQVQDQQQANAQSFVNQYSVADLTLSGLLPAGTAALQSWQTLWSRGFRTFKWKIGVYSCVEELEIFRLLIQQLPATTKLRLDANGSLSDDDAHLWLWTCDSLQATVSTSVVIEYIEQPLAIEQFQKMQELSRNSATPIALDESVATLHQLQDCHDQGWQGVFVVKPAIAGSPARLRQFCQTHAIDVVFSSAFETAIGRQAGLQLAAELSNPDRAVGYGTTHWFDNAERDDVNLQEFPQLWQSF